MKQTVSSLFEITARTRPGHPFLHIPAVATRAYAAAPVDLTYGQAAADMGRLRAIYEKLGLGLGQRVGLLLDNRAEFFVHWFALNGLGVAIVPLNGEATAEDLAYIVDDSGLVVIVAVAERLDIAKRAAAAAQSRPPVVAMDDVALAVPRATAVAGMPDGKTECALLYTSGSTGKPKGCILSNDYFHVMGDWYRSLGGLCELRPGVERLLTPLPLVHMNALATSAMAMILTGGCIIQLDRFSASTWWRTVAESKATVVHYLGVLPAILLNLDPVPEERAHSVRFGFGAGVNPKHHAPFEDRFGFPLIEAWSMTEVGGAAAVIASREPRHVGTNCFGKPQAFMDWRLVDDAGRDVAPGQPGELLVRRAGDDPRHGFFSGYHNKPDETAEAWAGGWFHTGDMVREGGDGSLHFVDRKKSIVRRSGENISSLEVEAVLSQVPGVAAVGVAPVPDDIRGEEVFAAIVTGGAKTEAEARRMTQGAADSLTYYKIPGYVAFLDALPLTASQKLQRGELKALARDLVERGEAFDLRDMKSKARREAG